MSVNRYCSNCEYYDDLSDDESSPCNTCCGWKNFVPKDSVSPHKKPLNAPSMVTASLINLRDELLLSSDSWSIDKNEVIMKINSCLYRVYPN